MLRLIHKIRTWWRLRQAHLSDRPKLRCWEIQTTWVTPSGHEFTQCKLIWCRGMDYFTAISKESPEGQNWTFISQKYIRHWGCK